MGLGEVGQGMASVNLAHFFKEGAQYKDEFVNFVENVTGKVTNFPSVPNRLTWLSAAHSARIQLQSRFTTSPEAKSCALYRVFTALNKPQ
jgi:hypothetical protein